MEIEYYKPDLEEFHVGFEFEYLANGIWNQGDWDNKSIDHPELKEFGEDEIMKTAHAICRVKYLNSDDIFKYGFSEKSNKVFTKPAIGEMGYWIDVELDFRWGWSDITILGLRGNEDDVIFKGAIKNKSELKRLLKQLNVTK